jgi:protein-disulfide isomerase
MSKSTFRALRGLVAGAALVLLAGVLPACDAGAPQAPPSAQGAEAAARIGERTITIAELDAHIKDGLFEQASEGGDPAKLYELRSEAVEQMIDDALVEAAAKERGTTSEALLEESAAKAKPVEQADVQAFYDQIKARLGDTKLEAVEGQIRGRLEQQRQAEARQAFVADLRAKAAVQVELEPPRIAVATQGPSRGPADAKVTIVEFSDYQCPYCKRAEPTLDQLLKRYPEQVRLVYRHFPLDGHPEARPAAEAAACAGDQGKFWEYHALVFQSSPQLGQEKLRELAGKAKLDVAAFDACLAAGTHKNTVEGDLEAGREAGVDGTPAFFVNGIPLSGARSLQEFVKLIDAELARGQQAGS